MIFIIQNLHGRPVFRIMAVPAARIKEHSACGKYSMRACISLLCTFSGVIFEEMAAVSWRFQWSGLSQQRVWKYHPSWKQTKGDLRQAVIAADFWLEQGNCLYQPFFVSRVFFYYCFFGCFFTLHEHDIPYSFKTYKKSCCPRFSPLLYNFSIPVCGEFATATRP